MKKRTLAYFKKIKAQKILSNPLAADLRSLLNASFELAQSKVVKRHVQNQIRSLEENWYRMSA
ncbi:MAG: hypothetical protein K0R82_1846 [Flavipsychrobacter sp.]|jgi:hypothetical protein|nr:hypothetical protein [Flavipsychrobacter sp.]